MDVMPPYLLVCQGTAESELQGTGLLNIAGEKIECSGILGHSTVMKSENSFGCSFLKENLISGKISLAFSA